MTELTEDDQGKDVVTATGDKVGIVTQVEADRAMVDPDPGITDQIKASLGWEDAEGENYPLEFDRVDRVTDDEVHLQE